MDSALFDRGALFGTDAMARRVALIDTAQIKSASANTLLRARATLNKASFSERTRSREVRLYRRPRLGAPIHFRGGEPEMVDPPSRSKPGTPPREEVQRERTVIVPSTDSVEDIVAKLIEGTDVTKLREIAKGLNAHVKKRIDEFWEH
jgi:hypothetical protein